MDGLSPPSTPQYSSHVSSIHLSIPPPFPQTKNVPKGRTKSFLLNWWVIKPHRLGSHHFWGSGITPSAPPSSHTLLSLQTQVLLWMLGLTRKHTKTKWHCPDPPIDDRVGHRPKTCDALSNALPTPFVATAVIKWIPHVWWDDPVGTASIEGIREHSSDHQILWQQSDSSQTWYYWLYALLSAGVERFFSHCRQRQVVCVKAFTPTARRVNLLVFSFSVATDM